jgi:uncharacterized membrane protein
MQCANCRTLYAPHVERPVLDAIAGAFVMLGKVVLILAGLVVVAVGVLFAGCLLGGFR